MLVTHIHPSNPPTRTLLRLTAVLALALMVAAPASAQLPGLPAADLPALPSTAPSASAAGQSASAHTGGHAVGACAHADHEALAGTATGALPAEAAGALATAQGAAATASGLAPVPAPSAPSIEAPECVHLDADHPEQAVADAEGAADGAKNSVMRWLGSLFGGLF